MPHSEPKELIQAKNLINESKLDEALKILNNLEQKEDVTDQGIVSCQLLKGQLLFWQGKHEDAIKLGEQMYEEGQKYNDKLQSIDGLFIICNNLSSNRLRKFNKALSIIEQAEILLKNIPQISTQDLKKRKAQIASVKGWIYSQLGNLDQAKKCLEWRLSLRGEVGGLVENISPYYVMALILLNKGNLDNALEYIKQGLSIGKVIKNSYLIGVGYLMLGFMYGMKGESKLSLSHFKKSLAIFKKIKNKWLIGTLFNNIGETYSFIGELDLALDYLEQSLKVLGKVNPMRLAFCLDSLIQISLEKGERERAQQYFQRLKQIAKQEKSRDNILIYKYNKALMLKASPRIRNRAKAEELFKLVIKGETLSFEIHIRALIHLCDLLLIELRTTNDIEVLDEVNHYISQLLSIAENSHSFWVLGETYLLQAKLALISFDLKEARLILTQGQQIAERNGLKLLAIKISNEHDELLKQLDLWENLIESNAPLEDRMELSRLNDQMDNMTRKRALKPIDVPDETPVVLLIISEGGNPLFSHSFAKEWSFEDHLFGGFLIAINSFSDEIFSEGLDRAVFGSYTLLMKSVAPFLVCYLFKGQSYFAQQKIKYFVDKIQTNNTIWERLNKFFQTNQEIQLEDIPSLEPLINGVFITKSIPQIE
ncbi:MAG: tetratricopeptide repeat protein [Promethearchaeota archaeon]